MHTEKQTRRPRKTPGGGQFAATSRPDPHLTLGEREDAAPNTNPQVVESWTRGGTGDAEFNRRARILLGVSDQELKVAVTMAGCTKRLYGFSDTVSSWTDITVACGDQRRTFADLPTLLRHLEYAECPTVDGARVRPMIGHRVRLHTKAGPVLTGRVDNANAMRLYFIGDEAVRHLDLEWDGNVLRPWFNQLLHIELEGPTPGARS